MVWKMYFLSNMAILGIYAKFPGGRSLGSLAFSRRIKGEIKVLHRILFKHDVTKSQSFQKPPSHPPPKHGHGAIGK